MSENFDNADVFDNILKFKPIFYHDSSSVDFMSKLH